MNLLRETSLDTHPEAAIDAARRMEEILTAHPDGAVTEILRLVPDRRAVFAGHWQGRAAIFRLALCATETAEITAQWGEMQRLAPTMSDGPHRIASPLALLPGGIVLVAGTVAGVPLLNHLWALDPARRIAEQARAAGWLAAYTRNTEDWRPVNRGPWRSWAAEAVPRQPHPRLQKVEARLLQKFHRLSRLIGGDCTWRTVICHGDFHPNNLLRDDQALHGIDLGAGLRAPVYRDVARFLVHAARRDMLPGRRRHFGVDAEGFDAFADAFRMTERERTLYLPFFITFETLIRVEHPRMPARRIAHTRAMSDALLEDLRQLVRG